eukprot:Skav201943  [mRNA]  locus=scaffold2764:86215:87123:- [translate_table: standard]
MSPLLEATRQNCSFRLCSIEDGREKYLTCTGEGYHWSRASLTFLTDSPEKDEEDEQLWIATAFDSAFKLQNVRWGLYLCAHQTITGPLVFSHPKNLEADQAWYCRTLPNGFFTLENVSSGLVFPSSKWFLQRRGPRTVRDAQFVPAGNSRYVSAGLGCAAAGAVAWIATAFDSAFKLQNVRWGLYLCAHQTITGPLVFSHPKNLEADQAWYCRTLPNGFFTLENVSSGLVFPSSKWFLQRRGPRTVRDAQFVPAGNSRYVSAGLGCAAAGAVAAVAGLGYMASGGRDGRDGRDGVNTEEGEP